MNTPAIALTTALIAGSWLILASLAVAAGLPAPDLWQVILLGLVIWFLADSGVPESEPEPEPDAQPEPTPAPAPLPTPALCQCPVCRTRRGETVPIVDRMPRLAAIASRHKADEGDGVLVLAGDADREPFWLLMGLIERPADRDDPRALIYIRQALAVARARGVDPRTNQIIAVIESERAALYVVNADEPADTNAKSVLAA